MTANPGGGEKQKYVFLERGGGCVWEAKCVFFVLILIPNWCTVRLMVAICLVVYRKIVMLCHVSSSRSRRQCRLCRLWRTCRRQSLCCPRFPRAFCLLPQPLPSRWRNLRPPAALPLRTLPSLLTPASVTRRRSRPTRKLGMHTGPESAPNGAGPMPRRRSGTREVSSPYH